MRDWVVAVLSTDYDLKEYRLAIIDELNKKNDIIASAFEMADFPVEPNLHSHESCIVALQRSDIAILIIDKRYGGIYYEDSEISITEEEYLSVINSKKPCLVFVSNKAWDDRHLYNRIFKESGKSRDEFDSSYKPQYAENLNVIHFINTIQESYHTLGCSNWISFFDSIPDILAKIQGKLEGLSRFWIEKIIDEQVKILNARKTSTGFSMSLGDVFKRGYYIEPTYEIESGEIDESVMEIENRIVETLKKNMSILIYGEAGYGKTTILAKSFLSHVSKYKCKIDTYSPPLYLWLKNKDGNYHFNLDNYIAECFIENLQLKPYPYMVTRTLNPYFYLDGFDEIAEELSEAEIKKIASSDIFKFPLMLTSRSHYAIRYVSNYDLSNKFNTRIKIKKWDSDKAKGYIENFCKCQNKDKEYASKIQLLINKNKELSGIVDNPLLITMLLWIIEDNRMTIPGAVTNRINLFQECIKQMAKREVSRLKNKRIIEKDIISIWSYFAWHVYKAKIEKKLLKVNEIVDLLIKDHQFGTGDRVNEVIFDAIFDIANNEIVYGTFHEQFLEFLVANALIMACVCKNEPYPEFLEYVIRPEINRNFRQILNDANPDIKEKIIQNINTQYTDNLGDDSSIAVAKRVHAIYHISRLDSPSRDLIIKKAFNMESHISVKLSLYFGAIKAGDLNKEEEFSVLLEKDEYDSANRGYHLAYYSDTIMGSCLPFVDDKSISWNGTLKAFLRHFESNDIEHYYLRRIDLLTMCKLMEVRNSVEPLTDSIVDKFQTMTYNPTIVHLPDFQIKIEKSFEDFKAKYKSILSAN
ncbi:DUF4062 domain-containing protein [Kineothrix sp. MB12-C1]|uniref:DUF4062 domain-containing protein n=1 Tax=Kineothrix sp. MB12-C1 TaxID=3070215 RepID=UPI0027D2D138|nr:DUF4062 domain-containing protein [Kineothrix sp. MB12-C1]WMC93498.1 DUF4062 domain-containing protein [Kineothrix sp. MB12-C1]